MKLKRICVLYFSPTGGTEKIARFVAGELAETLGLQQEFFDFTTPEGRRSQLRFEADDLRLYLDTHPQDAQALELLKNRLMQRRQLLKNFAQQFYPLTMDCMANCEQMQDKTGCYCWQEGPMPWEGACV